MEGEHTMNKFGKVQQAVLVLMLALFGSGASAQEDWVASVAQRSHSAVVTVVSYDGDNRQLSLGSGFVIREDGLIVTNYHVIKSASAVEVANPSIGKYRVRGVVAFNRDLDFAVLKIQADDLTALPLGNSTQVRLGESIVAIGNPKGLSGTVSAGLISQFREESSYRMLQISAPIYPGNSGGPLINRRGEVVGIITARVGDGPTLGLALPINYLHQALQRGMAGFHTFRELAQLETQESGREKEEQIKRLITENFRGYQDPRGLFKLLLPREWKIQQDAVRSTDGQQLTTTIVATPGEAELSELHGYVSEGLRIIALTPRAGNVWTPAALGNWEKGVVKDLLTANPGFAHTKSERVPLPGDGRLKGEVATLHHFVGEDRRLSEPEKTVKLVLAHPEVILSIEFIAPTSKIQMLDLMQIVTLLSFSWNGQ